MLEEDLAKYKFIVYARFTSKDTNYYPCLCEKVVPSQIMKDTLLLHNVYALQDRVYPAFKIDKLCIRTENIMYICEGKLDLNEIEKENENEFETVEH